MTTTNGSLALVRHFLFALLVFGMCSTALDLFLLEHFEDWRQWIPLALIGVTLGVAVWHLVSRSARSVRVLRRLMGVFILAGGLGIILHYRGNMEFQLDMDPGIGSWELFSRVIRAKAPPALAPGAMAQLGLLGLIYTFRHPALSPATGPSSVAADTGA